MIVTVMFMVLYLSYASSRVTLYSIRESRVCLSEQSMTSMKFSACTRNPKRGEEKRLPTSFVGRSIGHQSMLHVELKFRTMVNFQVTEEFLMWTTVGRDLLERQSLFPKLDNVLFNEQTLTPLIDAGNGIAFIPWCSGRIIRGHGKGILVKFDGFMYLNTSKTFAVMPVI